MMYPDQEMEKRCFWFFVLFFFFHFFDNFSKKTKFEQTNLITVYVSDDLDVF